MPPVSDPRRWARPACRFRRRGIVVRSGGFTLLEVMIALAILAITLVTLYQSQSQSISMATDSRFLTTASLLAQGRMAEVDAVDPRGVVSGNGDFGDDYPGYTWRLEVSAVEELPLLKRMTLTVTQGKMATRNAYRLILYKVVTP